MGTQTATLTVTGMHCASCAARVERTLQGATGVDMAAVNLTAETATVSWTASQLTVESLAALVTDAGFPASAANENSAAETQQRQSEDASTLKRHTLIAAGLTLPVFLIEMGSHFIPGVATWVAANIGQSASWTLQFLLISLVMLWPGRVFAMLGWPALFRGAPEMNSLVALGTGAAWLYSSVALFLPLLLPTGTRAVYFEAVGVIITLILLGRLLEARAKTRAGDAIRALVALQPKTAHVQRDGTWTDIERTSLRTGDLIRIRPGESIATDGTITAGSSWIDESMLTGEPAPIAKAQGDTVTGGTINGTGTFEFQATATGNSTVLAGILRMVEDAQAAKLPIQSVVDQVIRWFVPAILLIAAATILLWLAFGPTPALGFALVAAVSVLIVACPCAMGLATPTSITVATGRAAELGVLFRKGDVLQTLQDATLIAFDKTGTLTEGKSTLTSLTPLADADRDVILQFAASLEAFSEHPLARAVTSAAQDEGLPLLDITDFISHTGMGISGTIGAKHFVIGNAALMAKKNVSLEDHLSAAEILGTKAETPVFIAVDGTLTALLGISDPIKPDAKDLIAKLHARGLQTALLTGDTAPTANAVAGELGIDVVHAGLLPADKANILSDLKTQHKTVFVGDGINDAPALSTADTGIAIGGGTDVALETADVVLMSDALSGVTRAITISHATMRNIRQNLFWAFAYNTALIPVAAGVLYPLTGTLLSPMLAAGAMALSSVFVVTNALRLRRIERSTA